MKKQTAGREKLGDLAPKFAELNDDVLFGEVWSREDKLSLRDRSIITVSSLMAKGIFDSSMKAHLTNAKNNGVTKEEMIEIITHNAFYVGWPNAWAVFPMVREVYADETMSGSNSLFGQGEPNTAYEKYFVGKSYLKMLCNKGVAIANVTFEPKCRNNWHIHQGGGQILLCTNGEGWYQEWKNLLKNLCREMWFISHLMLNTGMVQLRTVGSLILQLKFLARMEKPIGWKQLMIKHIQA